MKNSSLGDNQRHANYHEFRDLEYFRIMLKSSNDFQVKEILQNYIYRVTTRHLDHDSYIYLSERNMPDIEAGLPISPTIKELPKKTSLIRITQKLHRIIKYVMNI